MELEGGLRDWVGICDLAGVWLGSGHVALEEEFIEVKRVIRCIIRR